MINRYDLFLKILVGVVILYADLTSMEWVVHKYIMHGYDRKTTTLVDRLISHESDAHLKHHGEVNSDMSLNISGNADLHEGLFFKYNSTMIFFFVLTFLFIVQSRIVRIPVSLTFAATTSLVCTVGYSFLWNNFHTLLHGSDDIIINYTDGVTNRYQKKVVPWIPSAWFNWMMLNHSIHHAVKGKSKGNYNIILPGFDHVMGTYNNPPCFDNTEYCKTSDIRSCDKKKGCFGVKDKKLTVRFEDSSQE